MKKIAFLILHYMETDVTKQCVDSILRLEIREEEVFILIVDNGSSNISGRDLEKHYSNNKNIEVMILKENVGFSRGNNLGYEYIKSKGDFDFIVVANNDIIFEQNNFIDKIQSVYNRKHFFVMGPDVYVPCENKHANPLYTVPLNKTEVKKLIRQTEKKIKIPIGRYIFREYIREKNIFRLYKRYVYPKTKNGKYNKMMAQYEKENIVLHGCCLIFSNYYMEMNSKLFWPETYFYAEEDILYYKCVKNSWLILYSPEVKVIHNERSVTRKIDKSIFDRRRRFLNNRIEAYKVVFNYLQKEDSECT